MPLFSFLNRKSGIGIDFGTHKSAVSLTSTDGKNTQLVDLPIAVDNRRFTAQSIPTRASILETDEGEFDIRLANWHTSQLNTTHLRRFKLDIGRGWKENATPVKKTSGKNKNDITVEGLTARLLRFLGNRTLDTAKNEKRDISKSIWVIAVPSTWGYHQRRATLFAAKGAFLDNATIIDEPIAAAI
jgi:molecular chaperone DnaK (HSP70)